MGCAILIIVISIEEMGGNRDMLVLFGMRSY